MSFTNQMHQHRVRSPPSEMNAYAGMKKLFMTRPRTVAYLITICRAMSDDVDGPSVNDAGVKIRILEETERLILDVRAGRTNQISISFPDAIQIFISDP